MADVLLILWISLLDATRIDFLGGQGPFLLTPFLLLSPLVVLSELWRAASERWEIRKTPGASGFLLAVLALLSLLLISTVMSYDLAVSARRFSLLLVQVGFVVLLGNALASRPHANRILVRGAYWGIAICGFLSLAQFATWVSGGMGRGGLHAFVDLQPRTYFAVIPRFTGASHDANLGGFLILFYVAVLARFAPRERKRTVAIWVGLLLLLLTLSRSAALAGTALYALTLLEGKEPRIGVVVSGALAGTVGLVLFLSMFTPSLMDPVWDVARILGNRLTPGEGSTVEHFAVMRRGLEVGTGSVRHAFVGIGYGNAYLELQDFFPGNDHGNFHSLFVTLFAEAGAPATLLLLWVFLHLLIRPGPWRPLVAGLLVFNLFQQAHTSPWMWLILLLAWQEASPNFREPDHGNIRVDKIAATG